MSRSTDRANRGQRRGFSLLQQSNHLQQSGRLHTKIAYKKMPLLQNQKQQRHLPFLMETGLRSCHRTIRTPLMTATTAPAALMIV